MARVPKMTRGKISLERGIHCCPLPPLNISFARLAALYCAEYVCLCVCVCVCVYIYIYTHEGWNFNSGNYLVTTDTK